MINSRQLLKLAIRPKFCPHVAKRTVILKNASDVQAGFTENLRSLQGKGKNALSVTEFITQYDEIRQIYLHNKARPQTQRMLQGTLLHQILEDRIEPVPNMTTFEAKEAMERNVTQFIDFVDKTIILGLNTQNKHGVVRELPIRGYAPDSDCILRGVIDCVYTAKDGLVITETKTTRRLTPTLMRLAYHQALTYYWLLSSLIKNRDHIIPFVLSLFDPLEHVSSSSWLLEPEDWIDDETIVDQGEGNVERHQMGIARDYLGLKSDQLIEAVENLANVGLAPYMNLQFFRHIGQDQYEEEIYEVNFDEAVFQELIKSRADLFIGNRSAYGFKLPDVDVLTEGSVITVDNNFTPEECTASQRSAFQI